MLHPNDEEIILALLKLEQVPDKIEVEYEKWRRMFHAGGGTGGLGIILLIPMLRLLKVEMPPPPKTVHVDWRMQLGNRVVCQYGDQKRDGILDSLAPDGNLVVRLDGVDNPVELPRFFVWLAE